MGLVGPGESADLAGAIGGGGPSTFRDDQPAPVFDLQTEGDVTGILGSSVARQPDHDRFRLWEVAGTAHFDQHLLGASAAVHRLRLPDQQRPARRRRQGRVPRARHVDRDRSAARRGATDRADRRRVAGDRARRRRDRRRRDPHAARRRAGRRRCRASRARTRRSPASCSARPPRSRPSASPSSIRRGPTTSSATRPAPTPSSIRASCWPSTATDSSTTPTRPPSPPELRRPSNHRLRRDF